MRSPIWRVFSIDCEGTPKGLMRNAWTRATAASARTISNPIGNLRRRLRGAEAALTPVRRSIPWDSVAGSGWVTRQQPTGGHARVVPCVDLGMPCASVTLDGMTALIFAMVLCVGLAVAVVALVAIPARREGRDLLTDRGERALDRVKDRADTVLPRR